jgi:hypothetical protein
MERLIEVTSYIFYTIAAAIVFVGIGSWYRDRKSKS